MSTLFLSHNFPKGRNTILDALIVWPEYGLGSMQ